jgi:hypothetical protein
MGFLASIALVLLTLVGYSIGRTSFALKFKISPLILDLPVNFLLWMGAFFIPLPIDKGWKILTWVLVAILVGFVLTSFLPKKEDKPKYKTLFVDEKPESKSLWGKWKKLSAKMGDFQGRLMLIWFYFILILPFGILVRLISDPLNQKPSLGTSWLERPAVKAELDNLRKQF